MASTCNRFINRTALQSLKSAMKSKVRTSSLDGSSTSRVSHSSKSTSTVPLRRFSTSTSRSPTELGCAMSLLPLHSAVAVARLTSRLSLNSRICRALSQDGIDGT